MALPESGRSHTALASSSSDDPKIFNLPVVIFQLTAGHLLWVFIAIARQAVCGVFSLSSSSLARHRQVGE